MISCPKCNKQINVQLSDKYICECGEVVQLTINGIECSTVKITHDGIAETEEENNVIFVPRDQIKTIELHYGCGAQRPMTQTILGFMLIIIPLYILIPPAYEVFSNLQESSNQFNVRVLFIIIMPLTFVLFGVWMLLEVLKKNYYLLVEMNTENKKVIFKNKPSKIELSNFINLAQQKYGIMIHTDSQEILKT